jgi:hypothetical protein
VDRSARRLCAIAWSVAIVAGAADCVAAAGAAESWTVLVIASAGLAGQELAGRAGMPRARAAPPSPYRGSSRG